MKTPSQVIDNDCMTFQTSSNERFEKTKKGSLKLHSHPSIRSSHSQPSASSTSWPCQDALPRNRQTLRRVSQDSTRDESLQPLALANHESIRETQSRNGRFKCPSNCGRRFGRSQDAKRHANNHCPLRDPDLQAPVLDCPICLNPISRRIDAVRRHVRRTHRRTSKGSNRSSII